MFFFKNKYLRLAALHYQHISSFVFVRALFVYSVDPFFLTTFSSLLTN